MLNKILHKLSEVISGDDGRGSQMRFAATLVTITICFCLLWLTVVLKINLATQFCYLLGIIILGKTAQKQIEVKSVDTRLSSQLSSEAKATGIETAGIETNETTEAGK